MMSKVNRIALISFENELNWGLRSITEFLRSNGWHVSLYFLERYSNLPRGVPNPSLFAFIDTFLPMEGDIVGISFTSPYVETARLLSNAIRERGAIVIVGGIHPTIRPEECQDFSDYIIRGDGELAMQSLIEELSTDNSPKRGIYKQPEQVWFNEDADIFPYPRYGEIPDNIIVSGKLVRSTSVPRRLGPITRYQTFTSFGCPYKCTYCVNPLLQDLTGRHGKRFVRRRSIDQIINELIEVKDRIDTVSFEDEDFLIDIHRAMAFLDVYREKINLPFTCLVAPNTLKVADLTEITRKLKAANCVSITVGIQSAAPKTVKLFQRPLDLNWLKQISRAFSAEGILVTYDVILSNPFEKKEDVAYTVRAILELEHPFNVNVFYLAFFPEYILTTYAREHGIPVHHFGDSRTPNSQSSIEEEIIRLAEIPIIPRSWLLYTFKQSDRHWSRLILHLLRKTIYPLWTNRGASLLRILFLRPYVAYSMFKKRVFKQSTSRNL